MLLLRHNPRRRLNNEKRQKNLSFFIWKKEKLWYDKVMFDGGEVPNEDCFLVSADSLGW